MYYNKVLLQVLIYKLKQEFDFFLHLQLLHQVLLIINYSSHSIIFCVINRNTQEVQLKSVKEGKSTYNFHTEKLSKKKSDLRFIRGKSDIFNIWKS